MNVSVKLGDRSYDIAVTVSDLSGVGEYARVRNKGTAACVVGDHNVKHYVETVATSLAQSNYKTAVALLPPGEEQKSLPSLSLLYDRLVDMSADRHTLVVAVGGGVVGDLAGFAAATFARGLSLLMVPTTLLAMVDSSVGGKVGVNHPRAKNLIGAFHQPVGVWIDIATLATLPDREFRSGLAEVVKYGVILDASFFDYLETQSEAILRRDASVLTYVVSRCCRLKADVVEKDERETLGLRPALNYGHTFAHAFETASGYSQWLHGEAVAAGMICASRLAERRGLIPASLTNRQKDLLTRFSLPTAPKRWPIPQLLSTMHSDKKTLAGRLRFILPKRLGEVALFDDVPEADVVNVLQAIAEA